MKSRESTILFSLATLQFIGLVDFMIVMPLGIALGARFGWQVPFFALGILGVPLLGLAAWSLPTFAHHADEPRRHPLAHLIELLTLPAHVRG